MRVLGLLRGFRLRLGRRIHAGRETARKTAEQRELQRKQMAMTQLAGMLQNNRRDPGKPR